MSKELEALGRINQKFVLKEWNNRPRETEKDFAIVETALKALEIIKNKEPTFLRLRLTENAKHYNLVMRERQYLTQEEYKLLKEILKWKEQQQF